MLHRVEAIVIRSIDYGEGNKIVTLFTKTHGKIAVMARGAKKLKSRLTAAAQLFTYGEYVFYKNGQMGTLNHGEIVESHHLLREQLHMSAYAAYLVELADRALQEQEAGAYMFEQLKASLEAIEQEKDPQIVIHLFEMKIIAASGYAPVLEECVSCGRSSELFAMSAQLGGMLCSYCLTKDPSATALSDKAIKLLRLFQRLDARRLGKVEVKPETKQQLKACMKSYLDNHLGISFKARNFLDQMDKYHI